jgi:hypothetical protein
VLILYGFCNIGVAEVAIIRIGPIVGVARE